MTANGEVQTREEARRCMSINWTYSSKLCFLKEAPAVLSSRKLCEDRTIHTTGPAVMKHISSRMARELDAKNPIGSLKSFTLTIPWNLAKLVKIFPGIIVRRHHTDQKQMWLPKEPYVEWKKGLLRCYCSPVWVTNGGRILWNVTAICETIQDLLSIWKTHMKGGSKCPLTDISNTVWSNGRISPHLCERRI